MLGIGDFGLNVEGKSGLFVRQKCRKLNKIYPAPQMELDQSVGTIVLRLGGLAFLSPRLD